MYRAVTLAVLDAGIDPADSAAVADLAPTVDLVIGTDPAAPSVELAGADVAAEIRTQRITSSVSAIAGVPAVRTVLIDAQRRIIADALDADGGIVVEGRDIGSVVAPDAGLKVYLDASPEARAKRRTRQDAAAGRLATVDATRADVDRRDGIDARTTPLRPATDAVELDTTDLDINGVLAALMSMVDACGMRHVPERTGP
jgi:cytidylate kinase